MQNKIFLIGGGEIVKGETKLIDSTIKRSVSHNSHAKFLFFPTAAKDNLKYIDTMKQVFGKHFHFQAIVSSDSAKVAHRAIMESSVIYLGGGKTEYLLSLFDNWQLLQALRDAIANGVLVIGMSAGAQALSTWYADVEAKKVIWKQGWGIVRIGCLVHAQEQSAKSAFYEFQKIGLASHIPFIAISEKVAWVVYSKFDKFYGSGMVWVSRKDRLLKFTRK